MANASLEGRPVMVSMTVGIRVTSYAAQVSILRVSKAKEGDTVGSRRWSKAISTGPEFQHEHPTAAGTQLQGCTRVRHYWE